jgi:PAS domain S-box-containing protein
MRTLEMWLYIASDGFQLAAMVFAILMMRIRTTPRPWQALFAALVIMFVLRLVNVYTLHSGASPVSGPINSAAALLVSILILASLISIRKLAIAERLGEGVYRAIGESIDFGIWICDAQGRNTYCSPSFLKLVGMTQDQCSGAGWTKALHPEEIEDTLAAWQQCVSDGSSWYRELRFKETNGAYHPVLACGLPVRNPSGEISHWAGINLDIRLLKESEERERAARVVAENQSRLKDEFLATVSHELRTPLNAIVGWAELLSQRDNNPQTVREGIAVIRRNAQSQARLIEDLLDMSRIISGNLRLDIQKVYPATFIEAAIEAVLPAASAKGVRIQKILDSLAGPVSGDASRLQQVVWNLLTNAIRFTPKGGKVEIRLEPVNSHLEITVTDTGEGISPEFLPFVFERFRQEDSSTTRKHPGLGLGLSIVKNLVEMHGGQVRARSAGQDQGATFIVSLPVRAADSDSPTKEQAAAAARDSSAELAQTDLKGVLVLVVDDDSDARDLIARLLRECHATVFLAATTTEARKTLASKKPHVIVSDIGMPGEDGYQFILDLRKQGITIPAVALTAFARSEERQRALLAGYQMHLAKPVLPAELITVVSSVAGRLVPR